MYIKYKSFTAMTMFMGVTTIPVSVIQSLVSSCRDVITVFLFLIRALASGVFMAVYVYTPEVFPTNVRATAMGFCSAAARMGAVITPFVAQVLHVGSDRVECGALGNILLNVCCICLQ